MHETGCGGTEAVGQRFVHMSLATADCIARQSELRSGQDARTRKASCVVRGRDAARRQKTGLSGIARRFVFRAPLESPVLTGFFILPLRQCR